MCYVNKRDVLCANSSTMMSYERDRVFQPVVVDQRSNNGHHKIGWTTGPGNNNINTTNVFIFRLYSGYIQGLHYLYPLKIETLSSVKLPDSGHFAWSQVPLPIPRGRPAWRPARGRGSTFLGESWWVVYIVAHNACLQALYK
jgi:hypothetical protein